MNNTSQLTGIKNKELILKNIYESSSITETDKKTIEDIFSSLEFGIKNSANDRIIDELIRRYRPNIFKN